MRQILMTIACWCFAKLGYYAWVWMDPQHPELPEKSITFAAEESTLDELIDAVDNAGLKP